MSITDNKITRWNNPIVNEADRPQRSASDMKAIFDSNSNQLRSALNNLIDALASGGAEDIGAAVEGMEGQNVAAILAELKGVVDTVEEARNALDTAFKRFADTLNSTSGAGEIGASVEGITGNTVAAVLTALKVLSDRIVTDSDGKRFLADNGQYKIPEAGAALNGLPEGGEPGDILVKRTSEDFETEWAANKITTATATDLNGIMVGDGANASSVEVLPMSMGGTGASDAAEARANLKVAGALTSDVSYYVATTGSDSNDGLTADSPLKTINAALAKIPKNLNGHWAIIAIAAGEYSEDVLISCFYSGTIKLLANADTIISGRIRAENNTCSVIIAGNPTISYNSAYNYNSNLFLGLVCVINSTFGVETGIKLQGPDGGPGSNVWPCGILANSGAIQLHLGSYQNAIVCNNVYAALYVIGPAIVSCGGYMTMGAGCTVGMRVNAGMITTPGANRITNEAKTKYVYAGGLIVSGNTINPTT